MRKFLVFAVAATLSFGILGCGEEKKDGKKTEAPKGTPADAGSPKPADAGSK
jgi:hypothetical protein